ncbi:MAG: molybdenum ABC transporter ATP-binding protein [Gammaproteobacteria bacterium]
MSALEIALGHQFDGFELDVKMRIPAQGVTALLGHSGAGKSTVLAALAGIFSPSRGRITLDDEVLLDTERRVEMPPEMRRFGCVLQRPLLFPHRTVQQNIAYGAERRNEPMVVQAFAKLVRLLDLQPVLARFPRHLSGGEQQRVALARALMSQPRWLLLDEPLAAVDRARVQDVLPYLERLCAEASVPVVYVSHSVEDVAQLADRVIVLDHGRVRGCGATHEVLSDVDAFGAEDIMNVIDGTLSDCPHDETLMTLSFSGGEIVLPRHAVTSTQRARCLLRARDIMLSTEALTNVSAHNVLSVVIDRLDDDAFGSTRVALRCGDTVLAARITQASLRRLSLVVGMPVFAVFKAEHLRTRNG